MRHGFYRTPPEVTRAFLARLRIARPATILEPAAGDGAMLDELARRWPEAKIDAYDVAPQHPRVSQVEFWGGVGFGAVNAAKTHCPKGHEYNSENTMYRTRTGSEGRRTRVCRICKKLLRTKS